MAANIQPGHPTRSRWSLAIWGIAATLLLLPAIAMRAGVEGVHWTGSDFVVMGVLLASACAGFELALRMSGDLLQRSGFVVAVLGAFFLIWVNLAVGLVGDGANPANLMFMGVVGVAIVGAVIARFRAAGMAWAMVVTAGVHVAIGLVAAVARWGQPHDNALHVLGVTAFFAVPWLASAILFRIASRRRIAIGR